MWKTIVFNDGSNPYICKTEEEFNRVSKKYKLEQADAENFYVAKQKGGKK